MTKNGWKKAGEYGVKVVNSSLGQNSVDVAMATSEGHGVDAVIITAASKSDEIIHQAALMSRKRGKIVLVGVTGLNLSRDDFYKKELSFQVSASLRTGEI